MKKLVLTALVVVWSQLNCLTVATAGAERQPPESAVRSLKILTLNFNSETSNHTLRQKRYDRLKDYVRENDLDIIFVQEAWQFGRYKDFATKFAAEMDMNVVDHFENGISGIFVTSIAIIAKKQLNLRDAQFFKLPHSARTIGDGHKSWFGIGAVNMFIGGRVTLPSGENANIWTAHLSTDSSRKRYDQVQFMIKKMKSFAEENDQTWANTTTILAGDLNAEPNSPEMVALQKADLTDLWQANRPNDPGLTIVGDENNPEYNPIVHGANQFPSQAGDEPSERIDYIYAHFSKPTATSIGRVLTSPYKHVWMSDHFGLKSEINFAGLAATPLPSADSDFSQLPAPQILSITAKNLYQLPAHLDFSASAERGLTIKNTSLTRIEINFLKNSKNVYTSANGTANRNETMSFVFFEPGDYPYQMRIQQIGSLGDSYVDGIVHVYNAIK